MYVITFYSFKGGVGRTMALVNVAAQLAKMGRKVLLVDFDLEAPGLETFDHLRPPQPHPGMVEYVTEYRRTNCAPDVRDYIYSAGSVGKKGGQLWVMPAGRRDAQYHPALAKIDWLKLYREEDGFLLLEDTKAQWEQEYKPDYVLIDSRTGHADVEGICTRQLPDAVVVLFFPNEQNLVGLRDVCRRIRAEATSGLEKHIRLHFVMSNVPDLDDEDKILRCRMGAFRKELHFANLDAVIHRYESVLLFNQATFVLDKPRSRLAREYRRLVRAVITPNLADREGAQRALRKHAQRYLPEVARDLADEVDRKLGLPPTDGVDPAYNDVVDMSLLDMSLIDDPLDRIAGNFLDDADLLLQIAECRTLEGEFAKAVALLNRAISVRSDLAQAVLERAMCHDRLGNRSAAAGDLLRYLQLPGLRRGDVLRAFRQLTTIAPEKVLEAVDSPAVCEQIATRSREAVDILTILAETDAGLPRSIQLLQGFGEKPRYIARVLFGALMRARRWKEARELYCRVTPPERMDPYQLFNLAMIRWGERGELPKDLCRQALELDKVSGGPLDDEPLAKCIMLWRLGQVPEACRILDGVIDALGTQHPRPQFSYWTYRNVLPDQFLEECRQLRRMIQGEAIRPAFLREAGPLPDKTATEAR